MTILTILILNIFLPTLDTATDGNLVVKLYRGANNTNYGYDGEIHVEHFSHPRMATAMLLPFLLNYVVCLYTFFRLERTKKYTFISFISFIFALLNLFPQFGKTYNNQIRFVQ